MHVTIRYTCGHVETIRLYGNPMERMAQRVAMERSCECMACAMEKIHGNRTYGHERLMELQRDLMLPKMEGSPKQVEWAMHMRQQMLDLPMGGVKYLLGLELHVLGALPDYKTVISKTKMSGNELDDKLSETWTDMIYRKTDATWWIANHLNFGYGLCNAVLREWFEKDVNALKEERRSKLPKPVDDDTTEEEHACHGSMSKQN